MGVKTNIRFSLAVLAALTLNSIAAVSQQGAPNIVQPGAPGQPSKALTEATAAPPAKPPSEADIRFMQDMIMHHGQAVEMTELAKTRAKDPEVLDIARKIDVSQGDEIRWMKQWLADRGVAVETAMHGMVMPAQPKKNGDHDMAGMEDMPGMDHAGMKDMDHAPAQSRADNMDVAMMPGMLTPRQMQALRASKNGQFDNLFLTGMMQHHNGALLMVKQLFANPGAGQDPQLFDFASDVDNTQLAEINIMNGILRKEHP